MDEWRYQQKTYNDRVRKQQRLDSDLDDFDEDEIEMLMQSTPDQADSADDDIIPPHLRKPANNNHRER
jgi:Fe-S cluster assembly scaffold protein SufB